MWRDIYCTIEIYTNLYVGVLCKHRSQYTSVLVSVSLGKETIAGFSLYSCVIWLVVCIAFIICKEIFIYHYKQKIKKEDQTSQNRRNRDLTLQLKQSKNLMIKLHKSNFLN